MLAIRYQRTGRKGHAQFRVIVQDSRRSPSSGQLVAQIGHVDPHTKAVTLDKEKAKFYLDNGAQPSDRVARMFKSEGVKLPTWVTITNTQKRAIKNPEKLRKNRPVGVEAPPSKEEKAAEAAEEAETVKAENLADQPHPEQAVAETTEESATEDVAAVPAADEPSEQADETNHEEAAETETPEAPVEEPK